MLTFWAGLYVTGAIAFLLVNGLAWEQRTVRGVTVDVPFGLIWSVLWPIAALCLLLLICLTWNTEPDI